MCIKLTTDKLIKQCNLAEYKLYKYTLINIRLHKCELIACLLDNCKIDNTYSTHFCFFTNRKTD
jgi:hypothetical protein